MVTIERLLEGTGVRLDETYGPILVNPKLGRYVVRGTATTEAVAEARRIPGVQIFADAAIQSGSES
jgi:hypothetical protein